jgi:hypothetical protein
MVYQPAPILHDRFPLRGLLSDEKVFPAQISSESLNNQHPGEAKDP